MTRRAPPRRESKVESRKSGRAELPLSRNFPPTSAASSWRYLLFVKIREIRVLPLPRSLLIVLVILILIFAFLSGS